MCLFMQVDRTLIKKRMSEDFSVFAKKIMEISWNYSFWSHVHPEKWLQRIEKLISDLYSTFVLLCERSSIKFKLLSAEGDQQKTSYFVVFENF